MNSFMLTVRIHFSEVVSDAVFGDAFRFPGWSLFGFHEPETSVTDWFSSLLTAEAARCLAPNGLICGREPEVAMLRMEPSIDGNLIDGDEANLVPRVGEDGIRCLAARALHELDVRVPDGEGEGGVSVDKKT